MFINEQSNSNTLKELFKNNSKYIDKSSNA